MGFLFGSKPKSPKAPDPWETAAAQWQLNNISSFGPNGSVEFGYVGENGEFVQGTPGKGQSGASRVIESDFQREAREGSEAGTLALQGDILGAPMRSASEMGQEYFDANIGLLTENFERDQMRGETRLQNRGLPVGSKAFSGGMRPILDSQNQAVGALASSSMDRGHDLRQQDLGNRWQAITGGTSVNPAPTANARGVNIAGMINDNYSARMNQYTADVEARNARIGAVAGMAGMFL